MYFLCIPHLNAEAAQGTPLIDLVKHPGDGLVQLAKTVKLPVAQTAEKPALHDQNADLDLRFVARLARRAGKTAVP